MIDMHRHDRQLFQIDINWPGEGTNPALKTINKCLSQTMSY